MSTTDHQKDIPSAAYMTYFMHLQLIYLDFNRITLIIFALPSRASEILISKGIRSKNKVLRF